MVKHDLNDVRTFVAAAEAGTLSAAAKELNVPTSTVSRSLTRLERNLGLLLINRSSKGFVLTDAGCEYLRSCRFALQALRDGNELLEKHRNNPSGMIRVLCPGTMARHLLTPIIAKFVAANPALRINLETYSPRSDPGSRMDVDVIFTVSSPNDSSRRVRSYPGTARGLFASPQYVREYGRPNKPNELLQHRCIGIFSWKLTRGQKIVAPELIFHIETGDPVVSKQLALDGVGITVLPLWMAKSPELREALVPVLPKWAPSPIPLYALYSGANALTPKIKILLDFLAHYIGTDQDPRLNGSNASECFTNTRMNAAPLG